MMPMLPIESSGALREAFLGEAFRVPGPLVLEGLLARAASISWAPGCGSGCYRFITLPFPSNDLTHP
jgi:hypothetical protein